MVRQILNILLALGACSALCGQSAVRSFEPENLAGQLIEYQRGMDSHSNSAYFSATHETVGGLRLLGKRLGEELQLGYFVEICDEFAAVRARSDGVHDAGFVRMQCNEDLNLVFSQNVGRRWRFLQTVTISNKYQEAQVSVASVTGDDSQQVIVHKAEYGSGTGVGQRNFLIYSLEDGRMAAVLHVVELAWIEPPWSDVRVRQDSRFKFNPPRHEADPGSDTAASFEETQVLDFKGGQVELKREHPWSAKDHVFLSSQWYSARLLKSTNVKNPYK